MVNTTTDFRLRRLNTRYADNNITQHEANEEKDGRITNWRIGEILGESPEPDADLLREYRDFCHRRGVEYSATGAFGRIRKFWNLVGPVRPDADCGD